MAVPTLLYLVQNCLLFLALQNLPVPVFQVLTQGKHLCTALCSQILLGKLFSNRQYIAVLLLIGSLGILNLSGVLLGTQSPSSGMKVRWTGLLAVFISCWTSGFSGIYFEKVL